MSGSFFSSVTTLSAVFGAAVYLFGDGIPKVTNRVGYELSSGFHQMVESAREVPSDLSEARYEVLYAMKNLNTRVSAEAGSLRRQYLTTPHRQGF
jgi:hypothetical protein